jgi:predicted nuclease with TOPRIM domain
MSGLIALLNGNPSTATVMAIFATILLVDLVKGRRKGKAEAKKTDAESAVMTTQAEIEKHKVREGSKSDVIQILMSDIENLKKEMRERDETSKKDMASAREEAKAENKELKTEITELKTEVAKLNKIVLDKDKDNHALHNKISLLERDYDVLKKWGERVMAFAEEYKVSLETMPQPIAE